MARRTKRSSSESPILSLADAAPEASSAPLKAPFQEIAHPAGVSMDASASESMAGDSARVMMNRAVTQSSSLFSRFRNGSVPYRTFAILGASAMIAAFVVPRLISRRQSM